MTTNEATSTNNLYELNDPEEHSKELVCKLGYVVVPRNVLTTEYNREREVLLMGRLKSALLRINPWLADDGADRAIFKLDAKTLARRRLLRSRVDHGDAFRITAARQREVSRPAKLLCQLLTECNFQDDV
jgi:hypothetical protein